ncbi:MAG: response regulator [Saprospiraceae bacterium]|nr:response regulator [Saprospiraceae bacterium]
MLATLSNPFDSDSLRIDAFRQVAYYYINDVQGDSALIYLDSIKTISKRVGYRYGLLLHEFWLGYYYFRRGIYKSATWHLLEAAKYGGELDRPRQQAEAYSRAALVYDIQGLTDSARYCLNLAIKQGETLKDQNLITLNISTLGNVESRAGNHTKALGYFLTVDSLCQVSEKEMAYRQGLALHNIGVIYLDKIGDPTKALFYMEKAKRAYLRKEDHSEQLYAADFEIAKIFGEMNRYAEADSLMDDVLQGYRTRDHVRKIAEVCMEFGHLKEQMSLIQEAEALLKEAEKIYREIKDQAGLANIAARLGDFYSAQHHYTDAISHFKQSLQYEIGEDMKIDLLKKLADSHRNAGQLSAAYDTLSSFVALTDLYNIRQVSADLQEMDMKYQTSQKEREIVDLQLAQSEQARKNQRTQYAGFAGFILLMGISFFYYYRSQQRQKINSKLKELDGLKSRLFADISHELRTPISLIKGPVDIILQNQEVSDPIRQQLQMVNRNANRLNQLVNSVNDLTQLEEGKMNLSIKAADLGDHLKIIAASFDSLAAAKGLTFSLDIAESNRPYYYDPQCFESIMFNLLSNAFKFTSEGTIQISGSIDGDWASVEVVDTGIGLDEQDQKQIFKRYARIEKKGFSSEGIGIGLALADNLARLHKGDLTVTSALNKGSTFRFRFPIARSFYESQGFKVGDAYQPIKQRQIFAATQSPTAMLPMYADEPLILLVEDNPDMRKHLDNLFESDYRVLTASNGREGFAVAKKYVPDLIISDLMMPVMDGHTFLQELKGDLKTSHIPFIMLTANHDQRQKMMGLKTGSDDFLTKPFSLNELKIRVENLIKSREQLRSKYQEQSIINPALLSTNEVDHRFWSDLQAVLKEHLSNAQFSVEDFASAMHMSRMQLHRKLKALTSLSTTAFLRNQRLKAAAQLLKASQMSISEVAFEVGFSSPFYFTTCFKELYGVPPREYASAG